MPVKVFFAVVLFIACQACLGSPEKVTNGTYSLEKMFQIKNLTFPRVLVYDGSGKIIEKNKWPSELGEIASKAGESFCCVSNSESTDGEPPKDCVKMVYGEDINSHFDGLIDVVTKVPIELDNLPKSEYLIVEYFAEWCAPCLGARKSLDRFLKSEEANKYTVLIVDFTKMQEGI